MHPIDKLTYAHNYNKIIQLALTTLGLRQDWLFQCTGIKHIGPTISSDDWWVHCNLLYLAVNCGCYGYSKALHKNRIKQRTLENSYTLPITQALAIVVLEFGVELVNHWRWQNRSYGHRLRWKILRQNLLKIYFKGTNSIFIKNI